METYYKAINWNAIEDVIDKSTWEKLGLTPTRLPNSLGSNAWANVPKTFTIAGCLWWRVRESANARRTQTHPTCGRSLISNKKSNLFYHLSCKGDCT